MLPESNRGINSIVLVFFVLILVIAALIVMFSFSGQQAKEVSAPSEQSTQVSAPSGETGLKTPDASNVPAQETTQCTESCDDKDACTKDVCNAVYGQCDHQPISGCCGNKVCDGTEACLSSVKGTDNSKACQADCGTCLETVNPVPQDWCTQKMLDHSLLPPYIQVAQAVSGEKTILTLDVLNPSEFTAKDVKVEIYPSAGLELEPGSSNPALVGDIVKYDAKPVSFSFRKQTNSVLGGSNPTHIKLTYSLDNKNAVVCSPAVFGE